jgi:hypothetical protein
MEKWRVSVDDQTQQLNRDIALLEQQPKVPSSEVDWVVALFAEAFAVSETSLNARRHTKEEHETLAQKSPLTTLAYFCDLYREVYLAFERKQLAQDRRIGTPTALARKEN